MIPGDNLLADALGIIAPQAVRLYRWAGRTRTAAGIFVSAYSGPVDILGSVQAVDRRQYQQMGLEWSRHYVMLYTTAPVRNVERDRAGDMFTYASKWYEAQSRTDWGTQDGWNYVLAVEQPAPAPSQITP